MISPSRKFFFAIEAVLYIAYNASADPVSSREIAEKQGLPTRYLEQIMQKLVRGGVLRGVRGPRGGYLLARERRRIALSEICTLLREEEEEAASFGTKLGKDVLKPMWETMEAALMEKLQHVTMADLCDQAATQHIRKTADEKLDFMI